MPSPFQFNNLDSIAANKYEYVNILANTPKNPSDYTDLENMIRYRMIMMVKELYGNIRISGDNLIPITKEMSTSLLLRISGIWYVDGYRVMLNTLSDDTLVNGKDYYIGLYLKFEEIGYETDPTIAMKDSVTGNYIETSTRFKITPTVKLIEKTGPTPAPGQAGFTALFPTIANNSFYFVGSALWNAVSSDWDWEESIDFIPVSTKYDAALSIVNNAVHTELDIDTQQNAINNERFQTNISGTARAFLGESNANKIKLGFETENGNQIAGFEIIKDSGEWVPVLWMQPSVTNTPVAYITPDGMNIFDNKGYVAHYTQNKISVGSIWNGFLVNGKEMKFSTGGVVGLHVTREVLDSENLNAGLTITAGVLYALNDSSYDNGTKIKSGNFSAADNTTYRYSFLYGDKATDNIYSFNHKLLMDTPATAEMIITANVTRALKTPTSFTEVSSQRWILKPGRIQTIDPFVFALPEETTTLLPTDTIYVDITYSIDAMNTETSDVYASVGTEKTNAVSWSKFTTVYPLTELDTVKLNGHLLWIDDNSNLRVKKVTNATNMASAIGDLRSNSAGSSSNGLGGISVGDISSMQTFVDSANTIPLTKPFYNSTSKTMQFPLAQNATDGGLVSKADYTIIMNGLNGGNSPDPFNKPTNVAYVSPLWSVAGSAAPYFNTIQAAINYIMGLDFAGDATATHGGLIIVYPGEYIGGLDLAGGYAGGVPAQISIIAQDPSRTSISGTVTTSAPLITAYLEIPIVSSGSEAVLIGDVGCQITFGRNSYISSSSNASVISVINSSTVTVNCPVNHNGSASGFSSIVCNNYGVIKLNGDISSLSSISAVNCGINGSVFIKDSLISHTGAIGQAVHNEGRLYVVGSQIDSNGDGVYSNNDNLFMNRCDIVSGTSKTSIYYDKAQPAAIYLSNVFANTQAMTQGGALVVGLNLAQFNFDTNFKLS